MKKNKKGFTLIELLAVIVILAVILVIAVPQIMNVIENTKKESIASSVKMVAASAETEYAKKEALGENAKIECIDIAKLNSEDYASCNIEFNNGKATVTIVGKGNFLGYTCTGTKNNVSCIKEEDTVTNAVEYITNLYNTDASSNGLEKDNTTGENIRYVGASPKNYVTFNNELWRIIGIFNVSNGTTTEPRIKLIRDESIGEYSWDSSASDVNNGNGVNEWSEADVKNLLNTYYLNQTSGNCYNGANNAFTTCDFSSTSSIKGLDSAANSLIENTVWNTGAITHVTTGISVDEAYTSERGTITGKTCTSGDECNDSVTRTTAWTGKVGLMYPSDYGYASTNTSCRSNIYDTTNNPCQNNNWLHKNVTYYRTITPSSSASAARSWLVVNAGRVGHADNYSATNIFPVVYLKSSVNVIGGDGTQASPYQLSI